MYLLSCTDTYRVRNCRRGRRLCTKNFLMILIFTLVSFSYKTKYIKEKREIVGEYQVVTAKKVFNDEKEPDRSIEIHYEV